MDQNGVEVRPLRQMTRGSLDTYRLSLATGSMSAANDYMEMTQLALQAGFPSEAKQIVDKHTLRLKTAVSGQTVSTPTFETMEILGREESLKRVETVIATL